MRSNKGSSDSSPSTNNQFRANPSKLVWLLVIAGILTVIMVSFAEPLISGEKEIPYSTLKSHIEKGDVKEILFNGSVIVATPHEKSLKRELDNLGKNDRSFKKWRAYEVDADKKLIPLLDKQSVLYQSKPSEGCGDSSSFLFMILLPLIIVYFFFNMMRRMSVGGTGNPATSFGQSKATLNMEEGTGVKFSDVAGCEEAKHELEEIVDFLKAPQKYTRLGGQVPKGVLLVGPPGTGKTLLARAVAGEADVAFFNLSGSDFIEMFVGVGAARVRDLFERAAEHAPCIIFIDELDAIGKSRQAKGLQTNDEREHTLNALLVEMDGFQGKTGVILLAATNRPEVLDPALLRPGRFDRQVVVDRPDVKGRLDILTVHAKKIVTDPSINLKAIAKQTPGFNGADLANVVNEAALLAARAGKDAVGIPDFNEAIERVIAGLEKKNRRLNEKEINIVAYHESGHAIVTAALDSVDQVQKVSIVSRGIAALGYTLQVPMEDRYLMTKGELFNKICGLLGGRAAEEIVFDDISTGASNDLQRVTAMARRIVINFGMSTRLGHINYSDESTGFLGQNGFSARDYSDETATIIDHEVHGLIEHLYSETLRILRENRTLLEEMAQFLMREEVLDGDNLQDMLHRVIRSGTVAPFGTDGSIAQ